MVSFYKPPSNFSIYLFEVKPTHTALVGFEGGLEVGNQSSVSLAHQMCSEENISFHYVVIWRGLP